MNVIRQTFLFPAGDAGERRCWPIESGEEEEKENSWNELHHRRESSMGALFYSGISGSVKTTYLDLDLDKDKAKHATSKA